MTKMDRTGVARSLELIASYMELQGENPFRVRAFTAAAKTVRGFPGELAGALADGSLAEAKGIGPAILQIIAELVTTGQCETLERFRTEVPAGLLEMLDISGLGIAKIRQIRHALGIETVPELEAAARDGRLAVQIGPLCATDQEWATAALTEALDSVTGPVFVDVPDSQEAIATLLRSRGFRVQRPFLRMAKGDMKGIGDPARMFAVAGPELG